MRISLVALVRLSCLIALSVSALAVGFSRVVPVVDAFRTPAVPRYFGLNGANFSPPSWRGYLLDAETGALTRAEPPAAEGNALDFVTCSPWTTDPGQFEFIGRAHAREGREADALFTSASLIRFGAEGPGQFCGPADQSPAVSGRPAWVPGQPSTLLLCGGDGRLYRHEIGPTPPGEEPRAGRQAIEWACPFPGEGPPLLNDPICPPIASLRGRIFASLCLRVTVDGTTSFSPPELWWLELDEAGGAIVAAGRLIVPDPGREPAAMVDHQRYANFVETTDGRLMTAFLGRVTGPSDFRLMVAEVEVDHRTGEPRVDPCSIREVARDVAATTPPLSPDGRWVYAVGRVRDGLPSVARLELAGPSAHPPLGRGDLAVTGK